MERVGYPFKSKEHSQKVYEWKKGYRAESHKAYFGFAEIKFQRCPNKLMYQINDDFKLKIKYKCQFYGIEFVEADRFYPSSKICSSCGSIKKDLKLSDRKYICSCGLNINRDYNASINLSRYELAI